jgi:hypothetical protein
MENRGKFTADHFAFKSQVLDLLCFMKLSTHILNFHFHNRSGIYRIFLPWRSLCISSAPSAKSAVPHLAGFSPCCTALYLQLPRIFGPPDRPCPPP